MNLTQWAYSHRRTILFVLSCLAVAGLFSARHLPVGLFPRVSFPRVLVSLDAGNRPAPRMAIEVTRPVEEAVRAVPGVRSIRSTTSRGSADVAINFEWGRNMVVAALQVSSAINQVVNTLPKGTRFEVRRMDPTVFPIIGYSLTSDKRPLSELRDLALYEIRPALSTVAGVARIGVLGGDTSEYRVVVDPARLESYGLTLQDVAQALSATNVLTAVGRIEENCKLYLILSNTRFESIAQIGQTILRSGKNGLVRLNDVAGIRMQPAPRWSRVTADGHRAVLFQVYQQPGGNTVAIAKACGERLKSISRSIPSGVRIKKWYDQSDLVIASTQSVRDALLIGIILAAIILFLFLHNWRVTLIAMISVPMVLAVTLLLLRVLNMSLNIMTLGGMAAAVALIIDDAIVMIEHIIRRVRDGEGSYRDRVVFAAAEFTPPLAGSSSSTIIIFAPLAFLTGVTGAFFKALSLTVAAGLIISFVVAWLAVPLLAAHLLRPRDVKQEEGGKLLPWFKHAYGVTMMRVFRGPWLILLFVAPLLVGGYIAYRNVGSGFMPHMDEGGFILDYRAPAGTSLTETDRLLRQVGKILRQTPEVRTYSRRTGLALGGFLTEANEGDFFVRLKPLPRRPIEKVMNDVRKRIEHTVPGLDIEMAQLMEDLIGDLTSVPQPIEIKLFCNDESTLESLAPKIAARLRLIHGVVDVRDGIVLAGDALDVHVDRVKAALEGISPEAVTSVLDHYLSGIVPTAIEHDPKMVNLRVWIPRRDRTLIADIARLRLRAPDGHMVPLGRVVSLKKVIGQPQITREDLKRMVGVTGRISGRDMGSTLREVKRMLNRPGVIPKKVYFKLGGLYEQQQIAFRGLMAVFAAAAALVFALLLFLYERFRVAIAMLLTTLMAVAPVFIGLWLTGTDLNITAMMGMTMIIGIVTEVEIFYYSEYNALSGIKAPRERLVLAGKNRMRPIAMTTFAAILALLPLALGIGQGAAMLQPLAIAIISGLMVQLPLVLFVLPLLLLLFYGHSGSLKQREVLVTRPGVVFVEAGSPARGERESEEKE